MSCHKLCFNVTINGYSGVQDEDLIAQFVSEIEYEYPGSKVEVIK